MAKQNGQKHSPEQKSAEQLLRVLGAANTDEGVTKAQGLTGAVLSEPLILTVSINRVTGRFALASNVQTASAVTDLRMLHEAMLALSKQLSDELVKEVSKPVEK